MILTARRCYGAVAACLIMAAMLLAGCSSTASTSASSGNSGNSSGTATTQPTATPVQPCTQFVSGATPFTSISGVPGLQLPAGSYISAGTTSGGGSGQYTITTYTACFQGSESAIDGGGSSTFSHLASSGWKQNNLFPDPSNFSYIDYCSNSHECFNSSGSSNPFTFVGFQQYASQSGGYTTFQLQVATIAAPSCLNDPNYYSGTPQYTIYYDGNSASNGSNPNNHFLMPPGTRVSTYKGGGTAGSTYVYFCSAGSQSTVVNFLKQAMQNIGWAISDASASGFNATVGSNPTYQITVYVQNPNNYYLRVFAPM